MIREFRSNLPKGDFTQRRKERKEEREDKTFNERETAFFASFFAFFASLREVLTMHENDIARGIVNAAYKIHSTIGPGLMETACETVLAHELEKRGLSVLRQHPIPFIWEGIRLDDGFRADLLVGGKVIVELKSVEVVHPVHKKQLLTYLRVADKRLGLLINFGVALIKDVITRVVNGLAE